MSDLKINQFRERAEHGVLFPDLEALEKRGRALRQRRMAAAAGGVALVLATGAGVARMATDGTESVPGPATSPSPTAAAVGEARTEVVTGEDVLQPGLQSLDYGGAAVRFDVTGKNWEWWGVGMGLRQSPSTPQEYSAAVFFLEDPTARLKPCSDDRSVPLGSDQTNLVANVAPLLELAHSTVLQEPRVVEAFGRTAVHLRLETDDFCRSGQGPAQLSLGSAEGPGWEGRHVLDLWHILVPGGDSPSLLIASWNLGVTTDQRPEYQALFDSLQIDLG